MADKKISALTAATTPLAGTEVLPIVQSGATVKVANNDLRPKQIQSNATSGVLQVVGPAAAATRVMTTPDANFTVARTDAAQSFTGDQTLSTGNLIQGTAAKGVNFTANTPAAGMTSQLLNWYEEGTWTPGIAFGGGSTGVTYNTTFTGGQYTRIGNRVFVTGYLVISNIGSSTGDATITGLPFASKAGSPNYLAANILFEALITFTGSYGGRITPNTTTIGLFQYSTAGSLSFLNNTNFSNNATIYISAQYAV